MPQNISLEIAEKLFPNETWHKLEENLFIAQTRKDAAAKNKNKVGDRFNDAIKQGNDIYIRLVSYFSRKQVRAKIIGELNGHPRDDGFLCVYIEKDKRLYRWNIKELSDEANKNNPR